MPAQNVLVFDDDAFNREVICRLLASANIKCSTAPDAKQLTSTLSAAGHVDIVILDLEMPSIDGFEAFKTLRSLLGSSVPIIACSVHIEEMSNAREQGFQGFIGKPIHKDRFLQQLELILSGHQVWEV
jgi:CheY-like chemotaxis protein